MYKFIYIRTQTCSSLSKLQVLSKVQIWALQSLIWWSPKGKGYSVYRTYNTSQTCVQEENECFKAGVSFLSCCYLKMTWPWTGCSQYSVTPLHVLVCIKTCKVSSSRLMTAPLQPGSCRVNDERKLWPQTVTAEPDRWRLAGYPQDQGEATLTVEQSRINRWTHWWWRWSAPMMLLLLSPEELSLLYYCIFMHI